MKSLSLILATTVCLALSQAMPNLAQAQSGNSSGGGQGDHAFALQALAQKNPGLTPEQILFMAFQQSQGRSPKLVVPENQDVLGGQLEYASILPKFASVADPHAIPHARPKGVLIDTIGQMIYGENVFLERVKTKDNGPLLTATVEPWSLLETNEPYGWKTTWSNPHTSSTGLVATSTGSEHPATIEFRQYTPNVLIYVISPNPKVEMSSACYGQHPPNSDGLCAIGYFWAD